MPNRRIVRRDANPRNADRRGRGMFWSLMASIRRGYHRLQRYRPRKNGERRIFFVQRPLSRSSLAIHRDLARDFAWHESESGDAPFCNLDRTAAAPIALRQIATIRSDGAAQLACRDPPGPACDSLSHRRRTPSENGDVFDVGLSVAGQLVLHYHLASNLRRAREEIPFHAHRRELLHRCYTGR